VCPEGLTYSHPTIWPHVRQLLRYVAETSSYQMVPFFVIQKYQHLLANQHVEFHLDNVAAVAALQRCYSQSTQLRNLAKQILIALYSTGVYARFHHIRGVLNFNWCVDALSRCHANLVPPPKSCLSWAFFSKFWSKMWV